jgi:imidazole glycerol-phosphate synthase subunit HisH
MVAIIDYGAGNPGSIMNMLKKIGVESVISPEPEVIAAAERLILPGVGAFDNGMNNLKELGLIDVLNRKVIEEKTPILGICLGMQLFTNRSEEGELPGLGWIDAETTRFSFTEMEKLAVPHMGWEYAELQKESRLWQDMPEESKFYFVHSYYVRCARNEDVLLRTYYGFPYDSAFERDNIAGVQFHPEKSHKYGIQLLTNFVNNF